MTKAQRILNLAAKHPDWSTKDIAAKCDCRPEYVRVVLGQRGGSTMSPADRRYYEANRKTLNAKSLRWQRENPERRAEHLRNYYLRKKAAEASP